VLPGAETLLNLIPLVTHHSTGIDIRKPLIRIDIYASPRDHGTCGGRMMFTYVSLANKYESKGNQMAGVNVKLVDGTMGIATAGPHAIVVDRSLANGGTYLGMVGGELLFTAIGTCLMTTLIGAARARNIELTKVEFEVSGVHEDAPSRYTSIDIAAVVEADATQEEIDKLLAIAERACTISNTVSRGAPITVHRTVAEPAAV
jgi:putative redox protein